MIAQFNRFTILSAVALCSLYAETADPAYRKQIEQYREKREAALKADGGWLTVTGLFWLKEGENTLGSDTANDIVLPDSSPARFGSIKLDHGTAVFTTESPTVTLNGKPVQQATVRYASAGHALDRTARFVRDQAQRSFRDSPEG